MPRRQLRVLIVDDNLDQVHTMSYLLRDRGHHVDYAINGIVALDLAQRTRPEVVVLDIGLPDASGFLVARQLRRVPHLRNVWIIGVTGLAVERNEALASGFNELLKKPLDPNALEQLLETL